MPAISSGRGGAIELPWPNRDLHPNSRHGHWGVRKRAASKARETGAGAALAAGYRRIEADALRVTVTFSPPDRRARDTDGMLSNLKSYLDGIADVLGVDDSRWQFWIKREEPKKPGSVRVEIEAIL